MPPKRSIRRPASVRAAKAKAKPAPKNIPDRRAKRNQKKSSTENMADAAKCEGDILPPLQSPRGRVLLLPRVRESMRQTCRDSSGCGRPLAGDSPQRHHFAKPPPMEAAQSQQHEHFLHVYTSVTQEQRLTLDNVGYLTQVRKVDALSEEWGKNCEEEILAPPHPPKPKPSSRQPKSSGCGTRGHDNWRL